jgi:hypothetical protein
VQLIRNRPAQPAAPPTNPKPTASRRSAEPRLIAQAVRARRHDPVRNALYEDPGEKCGLL